MAMPVVAVVPASRSRIRASPRRAFYLPTRSSLGSTVMVFLTSVRNVRTRRNMILRGSLHVNPSSSRKSSEGHSCRPLERPWCGEMNPLFFHDWTAMHRIDEKRPVLRSPSPSRTEATQRRAVSRLASGADENLLPRRCTTRRGYKLTASSLRPLRDVLPLSPK